MFEKLIDVAIVLTHVRPHITRMHGVDGHSALQEKTGELEHGEQLRCFGRAVALEAGVMLPFPAEVLEFQSADHKPMPFGVHIDDAGMFLLLQLFFESIVYDEGGQIVDLEDFLDIIVGEPLRRVEDTGIMDEHRDVPAKVGQHVGGGVHLVEVREVGDEIGAGDVEVPLDLLLEVFRFLLAAVNHQQFRSVGGVQPGGFVADTGRRPGDDD